MFGRRPALMVLALAMLAAPAVAKTDWASMVSATPEGGILIGNPAAKVKIVEFASYTCSHCKAFHEAGLPALKAKYVATGNVSLEQRSFVRNGPDFAASLLVVCLAPAPGLALTGRLFADQEALAKTFIAMTEADNQAITALPAAQQPGRMAAISGLDRWAAANGVPAAKGKVCLADEAAQERLMVTRNDALTRYKLEGTPTFVVNGATAAGVYDWASLEPKVAALLK